LNPKTKTKALIEIKENDAIEYICISDDEKKS